MRVRIVSVPVRDQQKALEFYTDVLGFISKNDIPLGEGNRWLTLVAPEDQDGPEVLLEPSPLHFQPSKDFQEALFEAGIPCTQFYVNDVKSEYDRLMGKGVEFSVKPVETDSAKIAVFNDTCGNYIQLVEILEKQE
jgi:catechol 2,3-dioxygenase-like lactoylglutathione lyase family enzyme